ncbi:EAL domain-containing protein [Photobacterium nomapromontoriensis]|uniref:putative bifunctional diguanylate cyclase/phosphodiesterase n=1 Tax=Photobacterium nomapromontoriensis TaxID=2910237 RepID=UPI003D1220F4
MKVAIFRFLMLLIPLLSITAAATYYIYKDDMDQLRQRVQERELSRHQSSLHITRLHFAPIIEDLRYLTEKAKEVAHQNYSREEKNQILSATFKRLSSTRSYYDQIRLLDQNGMEIIRVNKDGNDAAVVSQDRLQNKNHRSYIQKALQTPSGGFYTSQFDLNMENGQLEVPSKPMLRFISHYKVNGESWLLSLNYLGKDYLDELTLQYGWNDVQNWLINNEGQWLLGPDNNSSWLFMPSVLNPEQLDFHQAHSTLWEQILKHDNGQTLIDDQLYTYTRFFSGVSFSGEEQFTLPFMGTDLPWTIISRVNMQDAVKELAYSQQRILKFIIFSILVLSLASGCIVLAWHLSQMLNAQRKLNLEVKDTALKYATVLKHAPDGLLTIDEYMNIITINTAASEILMLQDDTQQGENLLDQLTGDNARKQIKELVEQIHSHQAQHKRVIKTQIQINNVKNKHIEVIATETSYSSSREILLNLRDITEWIEREEKLKSMSRALEQSNDSIIITDSKGIVEYVNPSFEKNNDVEAKDIIGTQSTKLLRRNLPNKHEIQHLQEQLKQGQTIQRVIAQRQSNDGIIYEEKTISPIRNHHGNISHYISTGKDITERMLFEDRLHKLAHYDQLTGLANRTLLQQNIDAAVTYNRETGNSIALLSLDLDNFKRVNDSFGHELGNKVIQAISERIKHSLRDTDFPARLGGDEFAILVTYHATPENISHLANRIINQISAPLTIDSKELCLTASVGISLLPNDAISTEDLNKHADIALYRAKDQGRNTFCFYTREMGIETVKRLHLESDLRKSLGTDRYELYYQPKVDAISHNICGIEALLRWRDNMGEIQPPFEIIPILERSGLIIDVGETMIQQACHQLTEWQSRGIYLNYALNISARQLLNSNLVESVQKAILESGCNPTYLELEITESVIMSDVKTALDKLMRLESLGVKIAVDDFGTGYSSLAYLSRFPIHILKVDREFVKDLPWNKDNITITRSIVELAHNLKMRVVAEGVETDSQEAFLSSIGVEEFQGFFFGRPMPIKTFEQQYLNVSPEIVI